LSMLNLISFLAMIALATNLFHISSKVDVKPLRASSVLLALFASTHGVHHLFDLLETDLYEFVGDAVFEPLSFFAPCIRSLL